MSRKKTTQFTDSDFVVQAQTEPSTATTVPVETKQPETFTIEEREIPQRTRKNTLAYPIGSLTPGSNQSFPVPTTPDKVKNTLSSIRTFAFRNGFKVTLRQDGDVIRVWRKAEKTEPVAA